MHISFRLKSKPIPSAFSLCRMKSSQKRKGKGGSRGSFSNAHKPSQSQQRYKHNGNKGNSKFMDYSNEKAPIVTKRRRVEPIAVDGDDAEDKDGSDVDISSNMGFNQQATTESQPQHALGMSRAAKKRLKKQQKTHTATLFSSSSSSATVLTKGNASRAKDCPEDDDNNDDDDDDDDGDDDEDDCEKNEANEDDKVDSFYDSIDLVEDDHGNYNDDSDDSDENEDHRKCMGADGDTQVDEYSVPEWVKLLFADRTVDYDLLLKILSLEEVSHVTSQLRANLILQWILAMNTSDFYHSAWGKLPCHCNGNSGNTDPKHFRQLFSRHSINRILQNHLDIYGIDVELLLYNHENDRTFNSLAANGREGSGEDDKFTTGSIITAKKIWEKHDKAGAILSILCPQKHNDIIWRMNSALEHEFGSLVLGQVLVFPTKSNSYVPAQYRKFDTFILQIEGECRIDVYKPLSVEKREANAGIVYVLDEMLEETYMSVVITAGDTLYIPIGWGYGQSCKNGEGGIQYCITTNIMNSRVDILELLLPQALSIINTKGEHTAIKCLPSNFGSILGVSASENDEMSDKNMTGRGNMIKSMHKLLQDVSLHAMECLDAASDQHMKTFIMNRLPIPLSSSEEKRTSAGAKDLKIFPFTRLRIVRPGIARVILEDGMVVVYHCMDNSREQSTDSNAAIKPLEYDVDDGPAIEMLLNAYPRGVEVNSLPHPSEELDDKIGVAQSLFGEGILYVEDEATLPFEDENHKDSNDEDDCPF